MNSSFLEPNNSSLLGGFPVNTPAIVTCFPANKWPGFRKSGGVCLITTVNNKEAETNYEANQGDSRIQPQHISLFQNMMKGKMKKKVKEENSEYDFCKLCKINHNQGRRHNFFPRHTNALSSFFSRFNHKLSPVKSSLKNPNFALASRDCLWCVFCECDIDESNTDFARGNAINHLASDDHLKNLKHFLWKYGGSMDKVDSYRITEAELAKWKKRCEAVKKDAPSSREMYHGSSREHSNDIHTNNEMITTFNINNIHFLESSLSKDVMPLQCATNENYQVCHSNISGAGEVGSFLRDCVSHTPSTSKQGLGTSSLTCQSRQLPLTSRIADGLVKSGKQITSREPITEGYQSLTRISCGGLEGNVHSGALPPWLEGFEAHDEHEHSREARMNFGQKNNKKTNKLNPKRVGAAWAEKRKLEMEMEKRGEVVDYGSDANWLPNFGRVWQSGSRKESMKEFQKEKLPMPKHETDIKAESEFKLHPYISKRMRRDTKGVYNDDQKTGDSNSH